MHYEPQEDCYACYNGKKVKRMYERERTTASGYKRTETQYHCNERDGCLYREACMPGKNWEKPVEQRYKSLTVSKELERLGAGLYERMDTQEGNLLRRNRSIQAEGSFGDIKADSSFTRFLCRGAENVYAEWILFAMAHNLGWHHSRIQNDKLDLHLYELRPSSEEAA